MPAGVFTVFSKARRRIGAGEIDLANDSFHVVLCDNTQALDQTFEGGSGDCLYADLTGELATGSGYTEGGEELENSTWTQDDEVVTFDGDNVIWTAATLTAKYAVVRVSSTGGGDYLLGFMDMDTGDANGFTVAGGDLEIQWSENGLFDLTQVFA